jgi:hypothetical protein
MKKLAIFNRSFLIICILIAAVFIFTKCVDQANNKSISAPEDRFASFAGDASCSSCHKDIYEAHIKSGHFNSSSIASAQTVIGSFKKDSNSYHFNPNLYIEMVKKDSGMYQAIYFKNELKKELPFSIVTGSGAKGQTYLYWSGNKLFQLPISYFTAIHQWVNSPGFLQNKVTFDKPVTVRCLECHSTYATVTSSADDKQDEYDRSKMILGIGCERCHGPAAEHVSYHTKNGNDTIGKFIVNTGKLSRQKQLDLCILCHGGNLQKTTPSFTYTAGEDLSNFFETSAINNPANNTDNIDVHGNQYGLLKNSKCFAMSSSMSCNTCHGSHEKERGNVALFSSRCMTCHNTAKNTFCTVKNTAGFALEKNCIDCHMPAKPSMSLTMTVQNEDLPKVALLRSHLIKIYEEETSKVLVKDKKTH